MQAYKFYSEVVEDGKIVLPKMPLKQGIKVEIIVFPQEDSDIPDMLKASESSLDFWDNPIDDKVWNRVFRMEGIALQVSIPKKEFTVLNQIAESEKKPVPEITSAIILDWLQHNQELKQAKTFLLKLRKGLFEGPKDLAENHDKYLYGVES